MALKEVIFKALDEVKPLTTYLDVYNHIVAKNYYNFGTQRTPASSVSAELGDFIRRGDSRIKRIKLPGNTYGYYLAKNEALIDPRLLSGSGEAPSAKTQNSSKTYSERDLHMLLSSYLKSTGVYSKTIFHEKSKFAKDSNQTWIHPDMVGAKFLKLQSKASRNLLSTINRVDAIKLSSYELKREINNDADLKQAFFQAVSNSSWANYGYLVAFEFASSLDDEMKRLNESFGIGVIKLSAYPYESKLLHTARYRELDFKTIDKLCNINPEFETFIEQTEKHMTAEDRYHKATERELDEFCDRYFGDDDAKIEEYCKENHIPIEEDEELGEPKSSN